MTDQPKSGPSQSAVDADRAIEAVRRTTANNILAKIKEGKTPTAREQAFLDEYLNSQRVNKTDDAPRDDDSERQPLLTRSQADKILRDEIKNLRRRVEMGKTLTTSERALIQAHADGTTPDARVWVKDQVELGEVLGVTRKSIQRWRKEGAPPPESDGRWNVPLWREWMKTHGKKGTEDDGPSKSQLEARRLLLMNEKLEAEIGIMRGEYVRKAEVERFIVEIIVECRKVLEQGPVTLAPQVVGLTVPEAEKRMRAWIDEACMALHTGAFR
jgi:hypothetical protein